MPAVETKQGALGRKPIADGVSSEISYFAWKRGPEGQQAPLSSRPKPPLNA